MRTTTTMSAAFAAARIKRGSEGTPIVQQVLRVMERQAIRQPTRRPNAPRHTPRGAA